jgi:AraC-like DNA-binding protein
MMKKAVENPSKRASNSQIPAGGVTRTSLVLSQEFRRCALSLSLLLAIGPYGLMLGGPLPTLNSAQPQPALRHYVRAYAQRQVNAGDPWLVESVTAQLEQVLNFELGIPPGVRHRNFQVTSSVWIGGAQTSFPGYMHLWPGVESFAIFFQPAGWSVLFGVPMGAITNRIYDATSVMGPVISALWNRLGEASLFEERVAIAESFLLSCTLRRPTEDRIMAAITYLFRQHGIVRIPTVSQRESLGLRQFQRLFRRETGMSPKVFARVARFQSALDAKLAAPRRSWLDIAHSFGYHDQMHMVHDFESLGRESPTQLIAQMGDVRPSALTSTA